MRKGTGLQEMTTQGEVEAEREKRSKPMLFHPSCHFWLSHQLKIPPLCLHLHLMKIFPRVKKCSWHWLDGSGLSSCAWWSNNCKRQRFLASDSSWPELLISVSQTRNNNGSNIGWWLGLSSRPAFSYYWLFALHYFVFIVCICNNTDTVAW